MNQTPTDPRPAIEHLTNALAQVFGGHIRCILQKGSTVTGDFIPGYSDLDLHVFLNREAMSSLLAPKCQLAAALQSRIGSLTPQVYDFSAFQIFYFEWAGYPEGWVKPFPGTYTVLKGAPPQAFATVNPNDYHSHCGQTLQTLRHRLPELVTRLASSSDRMLPHLLRDLGTELKAQLYCALTLATGEPEHVWTSRLGAALTQCTNHFSCAASLSRFFDEVYDWRQLVQDTARLRKVIALGLDCLLDFSEIGAPPDIESKVKRIPFEARSKVIGPAP